MIKSRSLATLACTMASFLLLAACDRSPAAQTLPANPVAVVQLTASDAEGPLPLLVPYRGLMVGIIDWSSYGIFHLATSDQPLSESDWTGAGLAAVNLIAISSLLAMPNSNVDDHRRLADPAWLGMAADLQNASVFVAMAVEAHDRADFSRAADMLADTCQSCHDRFRVLPSNGTSRFAVR